MLSRRIAGGIAAIAAAAALAGAPASASASLAPIFNYGTDTNTGPSGTSTMPTCGGVYGSYVGRINTATDPDNHRAWSNDANLDALHGHGVGSQNYYDLTGPFDHASTATEAIDFGEAQGRDAIKALEGFYSVKGTRLPHYIILYADIESGNGGWDGNKTLGRDDFDGFWNVTAGAVATIGKTKVHVYTGIYGTQDFVNGQLSGTAPHTLEWTAQTSHSAPACNFSWNSGSFRPLFFLGDSENSPCADGYQFISGNTDYDVFYTARIESQIKSGECR